MARELRITVGVIAERRRASSPWADSIWVPSAVFEGASSTRPGEIIREDEAATAYFMGFHEIFCHAKETDAYIHNFESSVPAVYVVMRRTEADEDHPLPVFVHVVTVNPYEALDYADSAEEIVERVQMPIGIAKSVTEFIDAHHVEEKFQKRRRVDYVKEERQFGKEPIFLDRKRPRGNGGRDD